MSTPQSQHPSVPTKFLGLWGESNLKNGGKNHFFLSQNSIIGKVSFSRQGLEAERAWLTYLRSYADPTKVELPLPIGPVVEDSGFYCLYLRVIRGHTLEQWIEAKGSLSEEIADAVTDAYLALRAVPLTGDDHVVPWGLEWPVMGQVFTTDNEAEYVVSKRSQFYAMMDERFRIAMGGDVKLPRRKAAFAHGDISPTNILLTSNHRIAILDFGMSAWLPEYWDAYNLTRDRYAPGFLGPIRKAFAKKGIWMGDNDNDPTRKLLEIFDSWSKSKAGKQYLR
jgi:Phosphotransferase enzyme family